MYCQLETLRRCLPAVIGRALDELPKSLDETYKRTLLGIEEEKREFAHRLFQCLTVAIRPLRVDELAEVLAIRFDGGQLPQYHVDWKLDDAQEAVLSTCSSLISVVNVDGSPVVQFSHFSVKEFLTSNRLAKLSEGLSCYHVVPYSSHTILAQTCLSVLLHLGDQVDKDSIKKFPFAHYAAQHWVDHGRFDHVLPKIQDAMERLFDVDSPSFATWIWIYDIDYPFRQHMFEDRPPRPEASPLYYASLCGFRDLVKHLVANYRGDINARGGRRGSAVNAALVKGNVEIALLLLDQGADVNIMDSGGYTPLYTASEPGHRDNVEFLLKHHADVDLMSGPTSDTALGIAAVMGEVEIARILLHRGASVDSRDNEGWTPLFLASRYGHLDIVRLLIQSGAAVDTPDNEGWIPLFAASRCGHLDVVQLLIQSGSAVDTPNNEGCTPLFMASGYGHLEIVQFLIQSGAAINNSDTEGWTPLSLASGYGHLDIVQFLIQRGAAVDAQDNEGWTPLIVASRNGHLRIAQVLIDLGAAINTQDTGLSTPLHHASTQGYLSIVELLIEHHADVCKRNKDQQTPLHLTAAHERLDIARLLLKSGSSPNCQGSNGSTPLHTAAHNGHLDLVKLLVEFGADVNVRNGKNQTPLDVALASGRRQVTRYLANHMGIMDPFDGVVIDPLDNSPNNLIPDAPLTSSGISKHIYPHGRPNPSSLHNACAEGAVEDVRSLLDQGADINERNAKHEAVLLVVLRNGNLEVAKILIEYGADVNCRDKIGWTPLMIASQSGFRDIAELLLDHGADVNAKNDSLWTALHFASLNGHLEIVKLLLDRGADIHTRNIAGRTPSAEASKRGERDVVQFLSGVEVKSPVVWIHLVYFLHVSVILTPFLSTQ